MATIYVPYEVTFGPHGFDDPENFHGAAPYLDLADGPGGYAEGQVFQEYVARYADVPAGQIMIHVSSLADGGPYIQVGAPHEDFDAGGDTNFTQASLPEADSTGSPDSTDPSDWNTSSHMTNIVHPGGPLDLYFDLGGFGLWTNYISFLGVEIVGASGPGRLKVLTPMGWEFAIPSVGENDGQLKLRVSGGWAAIAPGDLKIRTADGWIPVN